MTCDGFVDELLRKMLRNVTNMGLSEDGVGPEILFQHRFPVIFFRKLGVAPFLGKLTSAGLDGSSMILLSTSAMPFW